MNSSVFGEASVQCCKSLAPELPPATAYGSTISRNDDPRTHYKPYVPMPIDATLPVDIIRDKLSFEQDQLGPYSPELVPDFQGLGAALFERGNYHDAIDAYDRAIHLLRVNEGLNTVSQAGLLEQVIEAQIGIGDFVSADRKQAYLFRIRQSALPPTSDEMLVATEQYADWHRTAYIAQLDRTRYPRIVDLIDLYSDGAENIGEEYGELSRKKLPYLEGKLKAHYILSNYPGEKEEGLQISIQQNENVDLPDLTKMRFWRFRDGNYRFGKNTIMEMQEILENDPETTPQELASAKLALGDWYQWHHVYAEALKAYRESWSMMAGEPDGEAWLQANFAEPIELPEQIVFFPGRFSLEQPNSAQVIASYKVNRRGQAKDIEIIAPSSDINQPAVTRAYKYLRDMRFRPRLVDGKAVMTEAMERSYTINY